MLANHIENLLKLGERDRVSKHSKQTLTRKGGKQILHLFREQILMFGGSMPFHSSSLEFPFISILAAMAFDHVPISIVQSSCLIRGKRKEDKYILLPFGYVQR